MSLPCQHNTFRWCQIKVLSIVHHTFGTRETKKILYRFLPALEPDDVAQAAINSILTNEEVCIVPRYVSYLMGLKRYMS